ncbi:MAG: helix-turn-helix domain-containing protein [Carbonactinosporaceae bacterium]
MAEGPESGPTALRILLGAELRRFREAAGLTPQEAGDAIRSSVSKISRMEHGRHRFKEIDVADLLTLYGVTDEARRAQVLDLTRQANQPGWWQRYHDVLPEWFQAYVGLEEAAEQIRTYEAHLVPGLLQTAEYATAMIAVGRFSADEVQRRVQLRRGRQHRLQEGHLKLWAMIDEAALRRQIGGVAVMRAQLDSLLASFELPNVNIQVTPFASGGLASQGGSFSILRFGGPELSDVVYVEQLTGALYLDKRSDVDRYVEAADRVVVSSATPEESLEIIRAIRDELTK